MANKTDQIMKEAMAEKSKLLAEHPELIDFQKTIDDRLAKCTTQSERMKVIEQLMKYNLQELEIELKLLKAKLNSLKGE